jgi:hypothetical protein
MDSEAKSSGMRASPGERLVYKAPTVFEYGTLREITLAVGNAKNVDGGTGKGASKTQP